MGETAKIPQDILTEFGASDPVFIENTPIAQIWRVRSSHGLAALKIYHKPTMGAEKNGFDFITSLNGGPVTKVYKTASNIALIEWLGGPSLGDMTRNGNDLQSNFELVTVANRIHSKTKNLSLQLRPLEDQFAALFSIEFTPECPIDAKADIQACQSLAKELLSSQTDIRPLHGDLHHDNIRLGARGYTAFDAKGLLGERAFELANAFRNPKGAADIVADPLRASRLLNVWSTAFNVDRKRLLQWASVKIALSISWRCNGMLKDDMEFPLLAIFIGMLKV